MAAELAAVAAESAAAKLIDVDATASFDVVSDMHQFETLKRERRELEQRVRALEGAAAEAQTRESALQAEKAALQQSEASLRAAQASLRSEGVAQGQRIARLEAESADAAEQAKGLRAALEEAATQQAAALTETAQLTGRRRRWPRTSGGGRRR